jgi:hypothetical protein
MIYVMMLAIFLIVGLLVVVIPRQRMQRRAAEILQTMTDPEETSCYLRFTSARPRKKRQEIEDRILEMSKEGWVFLKASEANPLRTLIAWGGGLEMRFVRARNPKQ